MITFVQGSSTQNSPESRSEKQVEKHQVIMPVRDHELGYLSRLAQDWININFAMIANFAFVISIPQTLLNIDTSTGALQVI